MDYRMSLVLVWPSFFHLLVLFSEIVPSFLHIHVFPHPSEIPVPPSPFGNIPAVCPPATCVSSLSLNPHGTSLYNSNPQQKVSIAVSEPVSTVVLLLVETLPPALALTLRCKSLKLLSFPSEEGTTGMRTLTGKPQGQFQGTYQLFWFCLEKNSFIPRIQRDWRTEAESDISQQIPHCAALFSWSHLTKRMRAGRRKDMRQPRKQTESKTSPYEAWGY